MAKTMRSLASAVLVSLCLSPLGGPSLDAAPITWIGGNADWVDGPANDANWSPADEPDSVDEAIFNTPDVVHLGSTNGIHSLTMSGGIDLLTGGHTLSMLGAVQLDGAGTKLIVGSGAGELFAGRVEINSGAEVNFAGGTSRITTGVSGGQMVINAGGTLSGHGTISLIAMVTSGVDVLSNNGTISVVSTISSIWI